jgi:hypothetical protein
VAFPTSLLGKVTIIRHASRETVQPVQSTPNQYSLPSARHILDMSAILMAGPTAGPLVPQCLALIDLRPVVCGLPSVQAVPLGNLVDVPSEQLSFSRVPDNVADLPVVGLVRYSLFLYSVGSMAMETQDGRTGAGVRRSCSCGIASPLASRCSLRQTARARGGIELH